MSDFLPDDIKVILMDLLKKTEDDMDLNDEMGTEFCELKVKNGHRLDIDRLKLILKYINSFSKRQVVNNLGMSMRRIEKITRMKGMLEEELSLLYEIVDRLNSANPEK